MHTLLLVFSLVLLVIASFNVLSARVNLLALGLAFWMLDLVLRSGIS